MKNNALIGNIKTVGDLIDSLQENFDKDRFVLVATFATCPKDARINTGNVVNNVVGTTICSHSNSLEKISEWQREVTEKHEVTWTLLIKEAERQFGEPGHGWASTKVKNILTIVGVKYVEDLAGISVGQLKSIRQCGKRTIAFIREMARYYKIELKKN